MKTYEHYPYATKITNDNKTCKKFIKNLYYENIPLSDILSCDITNDLLADNPILSGINSLRKRIREDSQIYKIVFDYRMYTTSTSNKTSTPKFVLSGMTYENQTESHIRMIYTCGEEVVFENRDVLTDVLINAIIRDCYSESLGNIIETRRMCQAILLGNQMSDDEKRRIDKIIVDTIFACRKDESSRLRQSTIYEQIWGE